MFDRRNLVIAVLISFILIVTLSPSITSSVREYNPWIDINDDGILEAQDLYTVALHYGAEGTPINKTALLLELLDKI